MKKNILMAILAAGVVTSAAVHAASPAYTYGDVFLGIDNGGTNAIVIDLGQFSGLTNVNLNLFSDLNAAFGTGWTNSSTLEYGVYGTYTNSTGLYQSVAGGTASPKVSATAVPSLTFPSFVYQYGQDRGLGQTYANSVWMASSESIGWQALATGLAPFGNAESHSLMSTTIGAAGSTNNNLDIYNVLGYTRHTTPTPTILSGASLNSDGFFVVPEPSTYALFGLGALVLVIASRRRQA